MWPILLPLARSDPQRCLRRQLLPRERQNAPSQDNASMLVLNSAAQRSPGFLDEAAAVTLPDQARPKAAQELARGRYKIM